MKDKFPNCFLQNEIDLAVGKCLKWSRPKFVHRAVKYNTSRTRAWICDKTLNGSYTEL